MGTGRGDEWGCNRRLQAPFEAPGYTPLLFISVAFLVTCLSYLHRASQPSLVPLPDCWTTDGRDVAVLKYLAQLSWFPPSRNWSPRRQNALLRPKNARVTEGGADPESPASQLAQLPLCKIQWDFVVLFCFSLKLTSESLNSTEDKLSYLSRKSGAIKVFKEVATELFWIRPPIITEARVTHEQGQRFVLLLESKNISEITYITPFQILYNGIVNTQEWRHLHFGPCQCFFFIFISCWFQVGRGHFFQG